MDGPHLIYFSDPMCSWCYGFSPVLDDLYVRQSRMVDPEQRRRYIRAFEKRLLDDEAHYIYTLQWHRIVPHSSRVRGWTITPSHYLNNQLDTVWLTTP